MNSTVAGNDTYSVLIIDSEPEMCNLLADHLSSHHIQSQITTDPFQAFQLFLENPAKVVIVDTQTPTLNGLEVAEKILKHRPETQVIVIAGVGKTKWATQAMRIGAFAYLNKPLDMEKLLQKVSQAMQRQQTADGTSPPHSPGLAENIDQLTGLLTHRYFMDRFLEMYQQCIAANQSMALCLIDVDDFRQVNSYDY